MRAINIMLDVVSSFCYVKVLSSRTGFSYKMLSELLSCSIFAIAKRYLRPLAALIAQLVRASDS